VIIEIAAPWLIDSFIHSGLIVASAASFHPSGKPGDYVEIKHNNKLQTTMAPTIAP